MIVCRALHRDMKRLDRHTLASGDVADYLRVTVRRVHQLDDVLQPARRENGHRRYDPAIVERFAAERAKRAA